jgi:hypothetical protein
MEADWEFEIGVDAPVIDTCWPGLIDLRQHPERICELAEAVQSPPLAEALIKLNSSASPVGTSKCDLWPILDPAEFDADEMDAAQQAALQAVACYIDLLFHGEAQWSAPDQAEAACKRLVAQLRAIPLRGCRVDLVIRRALLAPGQESLGATAYLTACGPSLSQAEAVLGTALAAFADSVCGQSKLQ